MPKPRAALTLTLTLMLALAPMAVLAQGAAAFYPLVAAQHYRHLLLELANISDGSRRNSHADMVKLIKPYSQAQLEAVADHMSRLPPPVR